MTAGELESYETPVKTTYDHEMCFSIAKSLLAASHALKSEISHLGSALLTRKWSLLLAFPHNFAPQHFLSMADYSVQTIKTVAFPDQK